MSYQTHVSYHSSICIEIEGRLSVGFACQLPLAASQSKGWNCKYFNLLDLLHPDQKRAMSAALSKHGSPQASKGQAP